MNERIKELALQAEDYATEEYDKWIPTSADDFSGIPNVRIIFNEKFAELIVRECAEVVFKTDVSYNEVDAMHRIRDRVKEHFGVKE